MTDPHIWKTAHGCEYTKYLIGQYKSGKIAASTVKTKLHVLGKFQNIMREQYKYRVRFISIQSSLQMCKEAKILRKYKMARKNPKITVEQAEFLAERIGESQSPNAYLIKELLLFLRYTGGRISATLRITVGDLRFNQCTIFFDHDKRNKSRYVNKISHEHLERLQKFVQGKSAGRSLFEFRNEDGNQLSIERARKTIEQLIRRKANEFGMTGTTLHSFRKAYSQELYNSRREMIETDLRQELEELFRLDELVQAKRGK